MTSVNGIQLHYVIGGRGDPVVLLHGCFLVGHDIGTQVAYSYAAAHPTEVKRLVVMDFTAALLKQ
jgi:pimeloyl-ACP methyl ester carboxylesterase